MESSERPRPCPICRAPLRAERHSAVRSRTCPRRHGLLFENEDLRRVIGSETIARLHGLEESAPSAGLACPVCLQSLSSIEIQGVPARGCAVCGALWFDAGAVEGHVRDVRRREHGPLSFAARDDVERLGADVQPIEVVAGLLAYYELEPTGAPNNA